MAIGLAGFASIVENIASDMKKLLVREESSINATIYPTKLSSDMSGHIVAFPSEASFAS